MVTNKEQHNKIDLMILYAKNDSTQWNKFLYRCLVKKDVNRLVATLKGIQIGMTDLANKNLNSQEIQVWFIRLQRSIENTLKQIYRDVYPTICDNPAVAKDHLDQIEVKRKRDGDLEKFLRDGSY